MIKINKCPSQRAIAPRVALRLFLTVAMLSSADVTSAQAEWQEQEKLIPNSVGPGDQFGNSVSLSGDSMFVGAKQSANGTGAVFIRGLQAEGSATFKTLEPPADQNNRGGLFGNAIAEVNGTLFVGAHRKTAPGDPEISSAGAVHVYEKSSSGEWEWVQTLTASEPEANDQFGSEIASHGLTVVISAPRRDSKGAVDSGAVYMFDKRPSGRWEQTQMIHASVPKEGELFGNRLAFNGTRMLVAANFADGASENEGQVFAYEPIVASFRWRLAQTLKAPVPSAGAKFGSSLDMQGDLAVIGAPQESVNGVQSGVVHVFKAGSNGWVAQDRIVPDTLAADLEFGSQVDLSEDRKLLAIGSPVDSSAALFAGAVYLFSNKSSSWSQEQKIVASNAGMFDEFGGAISLRDNKLLVGVQNDDDAGQQSGSAYLYEVDEPQEEPKPAPLGSLLGLSLLGGGLAALRRRAFVKR